MTDEMTRLDALRALLAKHEPDQYPRCLIWFYKQHDRAKLALKVPKPTRRAA